MIHPPKLDDIFRNPTRYYQTPEAVVDDGRLSASQKLEILKAWPFAAEELDAPQNTQGTLQQIRVALLRLHTADTVSASPPIALWPRIKGRHATPRPVHEVMRNAPEIVPRHASLRSTAQRMAANGQRMLVSDGHTLIGSLSLAAAVRATLQSGCSDSVEVGAAETAPIVYCHDGDSLPEALRRMAHQDSVNLAVLNDQDELIGDLSLCDLALEVSLLTPEMRELFRRMT